MHHVLLRLCALSAGLLVSFVLWLRLFLSPCLCRLLPLSRFVGCSIHSILYLVVESASDLSLSLCFFLLWFLALHEA